MINTNLMRTTDARRDVDELTTSVGKLNKQIEEEGTVNPSQMMECFLLVRRAVIDLDERLKRIEDNSK